MNSDQPEFVLLAGPSGSGKSTFVKNYPELLPPTLVTPDAFLADYPDLPHKEARVKAIAQADKQRAGVIAQRQSFVQETLLADAAKIELLHEMQAQGYTTRLVFMALEDPKDNKARVEHRIDEGGNFVPPEIVERDYHLSLGNLPAAMLVAEVTDIYDNSGSQHQLVASIERGQIVEQGAQQPQWIERLFPDGIQAHLDQAAQAQAEQAHAKARKRERDQDLDR